MAWIELARSRTGRIWQDGDQRAGHFSLAPLHYEGTIDSGVHDAEIDCTPVYIDNTQLDGWRVTQNGWHYALGQPGDKPSDGWVGFGGRQGQNWLLFRLARVGYMRWATREWADIGGAPTYDRGHLGRTTKSKVIGPNAETVNVESIAIWGGLWATPGGGELSVRWRVNGDQLKEDVIIDQAGREWIAANRGLAWVRTELSDPTITADELWFGFVFQLDVSDVPKWVVSGIQQDPDGDFDDDAGNIELRDSLNRLLTLLPVDKVVAGTPGIGNGGIDAESLRKRLWLDGDGNHYLLIGIRADVLAGMRAGPLAFDPTFNIAATAQDAMVEVIGGSADESTTPAEATLPGMYLGHAGGYLSVNQCDFGGIWVTTIDDAPTITGATVTLYDQGDTAGSFAGDWGGYDVDTPDNFNNSHTHRINLHNTATSESVADDWSGSGDHTSPDLSTIVQAIVDRAGVGANPTIGLFWLSDTGSENYYNWGDYSDGAAEAADLAVTWTTGGAAAPIAQIMASYRRRRIP